MIHALIVTHGDLGAELLRVVESLLGPQEAVEVLSNKGKDLEGLCDLVDAHVPSGEEAILFVDFCGGSPFVACRRSSGDKRHCTVISGVNLPMLTSFFTKRSKMPLSQLLQTIRDDAVRGIQLSSE